MLSLPVKYVKYLTQCRSSINKNAFIIGLPPQLKITHNDTPSRLILNFCPQLRIPENLKRQLNILLLI